MTTDENLCDIVVKETELAESGGKDRPLPAHLQPKSLVYSCLYDFATRDLGEIKDYHPHYETSEKAKKQIEERLEAAEYSLAGALVLAGAGIDAYLIATGSQAPITNLCLPLAATLGVMLKWVASGVRPSVVSRVIEEHYIAQIDKETPEERMERARD